MDAKPCQKKKRPILHTMDRISDLPDPIIHDIMSLLTTLDVTKLSVLSKRFFSLWASFPVIDLDQSRFCRQYGQGNNAFLDHVLSSVRLRTTDTVISRFSVNGNLKGISTDHRLDSAILMALANGWVRCMELNLGFTAYALPTEFASKSLHVLRLKGMQLDLSNLIQVCPSLTTVSLTSCVILQDIDFSSKNLKEIELNRCGVRSVKINASSLQSFIFYADEEDKMHCHIDVLKCENIMLLSLNNVVNGHKWIKEHVTTLGKLKTFILNGCRDIKRIRVSNDKLERVELRRCPKLTSIELYAKSLESFVFERFKRGLQYTPCNITFLTSKNIKDLSINGATLITDQWLETQLTKMTRLERLKLIDCRSLKRIKVFHERLQILELYSCNGLVEADIDTPQLVSFNYQGKMIKFVKMVARGTCMATLAINPWVHYNDASYFRWRELLSFFGYFKALKLICNSHKEVMIPEASRESLVSPLYDLQHFEIHIKSLEKIDRDLVDSLLWLSPLPKTLHVSSGSISHLQVITKFVYSDMIEGKEDKNLYCCRIKPIKCWKHYLKRLEIQSSGVSSENESIELQKYFLTNTKLLDLHCFILDLISEDDNLDM